jgi:hypothetical protein
MYIFLEKMLPSFSVFMCGRADERIKRRLLTFAPMRGIYLRLKKVYIYTFKNTVFFSM